MQKCALIYNFCVLITNYSLYDVDDNNNKNNKNNKNNNVLIDINDPEYIKSKQIMEEFRFHPDDLMTSHKKYVFL
jgi:hypothetical protein